MSLLETGQRLLLSIIPCSASVSSGCASETSSNAGEGNGGGGGSNGFDADYPDGGTIKRKPQQQQLQPQQPSHKSEVEAEVVVEVSNTIRRRQNAVQQVIHLKGLDSSGQV